MEHIIRRNFNFEGFSRQRRESPVTATVLENDFKLQDDQSHELEEEISNNTWNTASPSNVDSRSDGFGTSPSTSLISAEDEDHTALAREAAAAVTTCSGLDSSAEPSTSLISVEEDHTALARKAAAELTTCSSLYDTLAFSCEKGRIEELERTKHLDTVPEPRFDTITRLLAAMFNVPVCVVSLVDVNRGWFKSNWGPFPGCVGREGSFCSYITVPDHFEILIVPDCTKDARFSGNPYVAGPPELRYYSGVPLVTSRGHCIGTLCMCDFKPRYFPASVYNIVLNFAEVVVRELEKDMVLEDLNSQPPILDFYKNEGASSSPPVRVPSAREPVMLMRTSELSWPLIYANDAWADMAGVSLAEAQTTSLKELFVPVDASSTSWEEIEKSLAQGRPCTAMLLYLRQHKESTASQQQVYSIRFHLAARDTLDNSVPVGIPGFIAADDTWPDAERVPELDMESLWICTAHAVLGTKSKGSSSSKHKKKSTSSLSSRNNSTYNQRWSPRTNSVGSNDENWSCFSPVASKPAHWSHVEVGPLIGQGSYGRVCRGLIGNKPVAIKLLEIPLEPNEINSGGDDGGDKNDKLTVVQKAVLEAALSQHLAHPSIVPTIDLSISYSKVGNAQVWILQHLCDKGSLYDNLDRGFFRECALLTSPPSLSKILAAAQDIAAGLVYLHENNIVHGDLSGNNVLLSSAKNERGFKALLCDFGFSRGVNQQIQTKSVGTISHMPPEMLLEGLLTRHVDTYSFGVLLTELWQGKRAFAGMSPVAIVFNIVSGKVKVAMPSDCPDELKSLVDACLEEDPTKRPEMGDVLAQLEVIASALS